jgi:tetraacyldisaccharide 4'-kinase
VIIKIRNWLYNIKICSSTSFGLPIIGVGNLTLGGTGKSPMVEYLVENLKDHFKVATLSRGYKRKTKGYVLANENSSALEIGDEPMQFYLKFPDIPVAVGEKRVEAIPQLLHDKPATEVIILDDSFQHREIRPGLNILLTEFNNLFVHDFYLPTGDLRDLKSTYKRANIIIVTKCKHDLAEQEKNEIIEEIKPKPHQQIFFTSIEYGQFYHITEKHSFEINKETEVLLVTGIANPRPLKKLLEKYCESYSMLHFPDHHIFTIDDLKEIRMKFNVLNAKQKIILSTEKDAVRLIKFRSEISELPFYIIPIRHHFLFGEAQRFNETVVSFIKAFKRTV